MSVEGLGISLQDLAPHLFKGYAEGKLGGEQLRMAEAERKRKEQQQAFENYVSYAGLLQKGRDIEQTGEQRTEDRASRERLAKAKLEGQQALAIYLQGHRDRNVARQMMGKPLFWEWDPNVVGFFVSEAGATPGGAGPAPEGGLPGAAPDGALPGALPGALGAPSPLVTPAGRALRGPALSPALGRAAPALPQPARGPAPRFQVPASVTAKRQLTGAQTTLARARVPLVEAQTAAVKGMLQPNIDKAKAMAAALRSLPGYRADTVKLGYANIRSRESMSAAEIASRESIASLDRASREQIAQQINARIRATSDPETLLRLRFAYEVATDPLNIAGVEMPRTPEQIDAALDLIRDIAGKMGGSRHEAPAPAPGGTPRPAPARSGGGTRPPPARPAPRGPRPLDRAKLRQKLIAGGMTPAEADAAIKTVK